jgi:hypothetical protein
MFQHTTVVLTVLPDGLVEFVHYLPGRPGSKVTATTWPGVLSMLAGPTPKQNAAKLGIVLDGADDDTDNPDVLVRLASGVYKVQVIADHSGEWVGNELTFPTEQAANDYGVNLYARWTAVRHVRVIEVDPTDKARVLRVVKEN